MSRRGHTPPAEPGGADRRDRAAVPAVSKVLEVALVLLFVAMVSTALFGGVVPDYRTAAATEVADRTLAGAAADVEAAVPPAVGSASVRAPVPLPATIRGAAYRVRADGGALVLDHPHPDVGGRLPLSLPPAVASVRGTWASGERTAVVVETTDRGLAVELADVDRTRVGDDGDDGGDDEEGDDAPPDDGDGDGGDRPDPAGAEP